MVIITGEKASLPLHYFVITITISASMFAIPGKDFVRPFPRVLFTGSASVREAAKSHDIAIQKGRNERKRIWRKRGGRTRGREEEAK